MDISGMDLHNDKGRLRDVMTMSFVCDCPGVRVRVTRNLLFECLVSTEKKIQADHQDRNT